MAIERGLTIRPDIDQIIDAAQIKDALGELIGKNPQLEKRLRELGNEGRDNTGVNRVLAKWSVDASTGSGEAILALVFAGGLVYTPWQDTFQDQAARDFIVRKASRLVLNLDKPTHGSGSSHAGAEMFRDIICPLIVWGDVLDEDHRVKFIEDWQRDPFDANPHNIFNGRIGLGGKWLERAMGTLGKFETWLGESRVGNAIARVRRNASKNPS